MTILKIIDHQYGVRYLNRGQWVYNCGHSVFHLHNTCGMNIIIIFSDWLCGSHGNYLLKFMINCAVSDFDIHSYIPKWLYIQRINREQIKKCNISYRNVAFFCLQVLYRIFIRKLYPWNKIFYQIFSRMDFLMIFITCFPSNIFWYDRTLKKYSWKRKSIFICRYMI